MLRSRVFGYLPVRVVLEGAVVIGEGDGDEGKLKSLGESMKGSRDSSEDFIIVGEARLRFPLI